MTPTQVPVSHGKVFWVIVAAVLISMIIAIAMPDYQLSNKEIIRETRECEAAGMTPTVLRSRTGGEIIRIQCAPKESK